MLARIRENRTAMCMVLCAVLMAALLVLQFTPFWQYGEAVESCSIGGYIWFPSDYKNLDSWLVGHNENHDLNGFVAMPILVLVLSAVGAVICLIKPEHMGASLLAAACGLVGVIAYLTIPALKLGSGWAVHLLICVVLLALGAYGLAQWIKELRA